MIDYLEAVRRESLAFTTAARAASPDNSVPSCPEWDVADLIWHLTEVQYFWATIVDGLLQDPDEVPPLERPENEALLAEFDTQTGRLLAALTVRDTDEVCWSWHDEGHNVGWVRRRQAHEALIHRVDAELVAGRPSGIDIELAADGIDEILRVSIDIDSPPDWAVFEADGTSARIETLSGESWSMIFGQFLGNSPASGNSYNFPALKLTPRPISTNATIRGRADDLDLWLWGRGPLNALTIEGDAEIPVKLRSAAAEATQ